VTGETFVVPEPLRFPPGASVFVASERRHIPAHVVADDWSGAAVVPTLCGQKRSGGVIVPAARAAELAAVHCPTCARRSTQDGAL
jgi:hypothetical protein